VSVKRMPQPTPHCMSATADASAVTTGHDGLIEHHAPSLKRSSNPDRYDGIARFFHWIFAAAIIYTSIAGYTLAQLSDGPVREFLSRLNMSIATVLILLFPLRVVWKFVRVEPRALAHVSAVQSRLAHAVHALCRADERLSDGPGRLFVFRSRRNSHTVR
jgi:superoxide oxidase